MGGAIFVSAGEALFANQLIDSLQKNVPDINPAEVIGVGATELRNHFAPGGIYHGDCACWLLGAIESALAVGEHQGQGQWRDGVRMTLETLWSWKV
jgi:hypothetical protein